MCADYEEQPVRLRLTDVNDEVPQFQNVPRPFLAMVSSDAPLGTSVYQLMANDLDRDSLIRYSLESGKLYFRFYRQKGVVACMFDTGMLKNW